MRIITRQELLGLHEGAVYSEYAPCHFGTFQIKGESLKNDWYYQEISNAIAADSSDEAFEKLLLAQDGKQTFSMDFDCMSRDGLFDEDQLYAVWEKEDVEALVKRLNQALDDYRRAGA